MAPFGLYGVNNIVPAERPSASLGFFHPDWLNQGQKVMLLHDNVYKQGYLNINKDSLWEFVSRNTNGRFTFTNSLSDIQYSWKMQMQENTFDID